MNDVFYITPDVACDDGDYLTLSEPSSAIEESVFYELPDCLQESYLQIPHISYQERILFPSYFKSHVLKISYLQKSSLQISSRSQLDRGTLYVKDMYYYR